MKSKITLIVVACVLAVVYAVEVLTEDKPTRPPLTQLTCDKATSSVRIEGANEVIVTKCLDERP